MFKGLNQKESFYSNLLFRFEANRDRKKSWKYWNRNNWYGCEYEFFQFIDQQF